MKNFFKVGVLALVLVLVSGCGSSKGKVLTCTNSDEESGMKMSQTIKITFSGDKASKIVQDYVIDFGEENKSMASVYTAMFEASYKDLKGVSVKSSTKGTKATFTLTAEVSKMDDAAKEKMDLDNLDKSYDDIKKSAEDSGFKCK